METIDKIYLECLDKSCGCQQYATIMSALPQHKTDMIFRVENLDRYDDRDVIVTNLLDMYERMNECICQEASKQSVCFRWNAVGEHKRCNIEGDNF